MNALVNIIVLFMVVYLTGAGYLFASEEGTKVSVASVREGGVSPHILIPGNLFSRNDLTITTGVDGKLRWVKEPGSYAKAEDVLAKIDDTDLLLEKARLEAEVERHKININYLNRDLLRLTKLQENRNASLFQYEQKESERDLAKADLKITEFNVQQVNEQLKKTLIRAPINGFVVERYHRENKDLIKGDSVIRLVDTQELEARVFIPLRYRSYLMRGGKVGLSSSTGEGEAIIRTLIPASNTLSQTFEARLDLSQPHPDWTIGESVNVVLRLNEQQNQIAVPRDALVIRGEGIYVVRINEKQLTERVFVTVGQGDEYWVSVEGELRKGDKVVVRGAEDLTNGQLVSVI